MAKTTRPLGDCQHKEYDTFGRLTRIKLRDDCVAANTGDMQEFTYDSNGFSTKGEYKDASGTVTYRREDTFRDGLQLGDTYNPVSGYAKTSTYLPDGQPDETISENGLGKTKWSYDAQNREVTRRRYKSAAGDYNEWHIGYPTGSPTRRSQSVADDLAKSTTTNFDDLDRKTRVISPDSGTSLFVYDEASRLSTVVESYGSGSYSHTFTYDYIGRKLTEDYSDSIESCGFTPITEVHYTWDASPGTCPTSAVCTNQMGRLAHVQTLLLCDASQPDRTLDQMTYYGFDSAGRLIGEYISDDTGRIANQSYAWDKNGNMTRVTAPSGVAMGYTHGGAGNSDANLPTTLWRNNGTVTNLTTAITWAPFGPVTQYDQANTVGGGPIRATFTWNLAYRASQIKYRFTSPGTDRTKIDYTEDAKGRYASKVYSNVTTGIQNDYLLYDWLDRPTCDAAISGSCPTSGSNLKTNVTAYDASNDRTVVRHRDSVFGDYEYTTAHETGNDKLWSVTQTGVSGLVAFGWDSRGNRTYDDQTTSSVDQRTYTYDGRRRLRTVTVPQPTCCLGTPTTTITNAYDHRDRRVLRSSTTSGVQSQWFYYYDSEDRLIEVKYIPTLSDPSTYTIYQFYWLDKQPVAYFATTYPAGTTARYFFHSDESNRPLEVMDWPSSGDATVVWALNPDVFGWDSIVYTANIYQPFRMNGTYYEDRTTAWKAWNVAHRPSLLTDHGVVYDPLSETTLQPLGSWPDESYSLGRHRPASGLAFVAAESPGAPTTSMCEARAIRMRAQFGCSSCGSTGNDHPDRVRMIINGGHGQSPSGGGCQGCFAICSGNTCDWECASAVMGGAMVYGPRDCQPSVYYCILQDWGYCGATESGRGPHGFVMY